mgnify:CR=1 FL=1
MLGGLASLFKDKSYYFPLNNSTAYTSPYSNALRIDFGSPDPVVWRPRYQDTEPRKGFHISWVADGVSIGGMRFNDQSGRIAGVRRRSAELRQVMAPERRHVAMDNSTLERLVELWDEEWPPTLRGRFRL